MTDMSTAAAATAITPRPSWPGVPSPVLREFRRVGRECARRGLVVARQGNLSARQGGGFLISIAGTDLDALTVADVVSLDRCDGSRARNERPSMEWPLHARIYAERSDVGAILHTHSPYATAWSYLSEPLGADSRELRPPVDRPIGTARDAPAGSIALAEAAADALADHSAVLLARHGVVGVGATLAEALDVCTLVEHHAHVAWILRSGVGAEMGRRV